MAFLTQWKRLDGIESRFESRSLAEPPPKHGSENRRGGRITQAQKALS